MTRRPDEAVGPAVRPARPRERAELGRMLTAAFEQDPGMRWLLPDDPSWRRHAPGIFEWYMGRVPAPELVATTDDLGAAAIWYPPGQAHPGLGARLLDLVGTFTVVGARALSVLRYQRRLVAAHPADPHWYLAVLGVAPGRRGAGLGSALLRDGLARSDAAGLPAYLETTRPENVDFYRRFGFAVGRELRERGLPRTWFMLREAC